MHVVAQPVNVVQWPAPAVPPAARLMTQDLTMHDIMSQPDFFKQLALSVTDHLRSHQVCKAAALLPLAGLDVCPILMDDQHV